MMVYPAVWKLGGVSRRGFLSGLVMKFQDEFRLRGERRRIVEAAVRDALSIDPSVRLKDFSLSTLLVPRSCQRLNLCFLLQYLVSNEDGVEVKYY